MTVAHDAYVRQLIARAKDGTIPPQEVKQIAQAVTECRAGRELYQRLYAVARAGGPAYEPLIAAYLIYPEDPEVSALAVQVLTAHWRVGAKYRKQILELLGSPSGTWMTTCSWPRSRGWVDPARRVRRRTPPRPAEARRGRPR